MELSPSQTGGSHQPDRSRAARFSVLAVLAVLMLLGTAAHVRLWKFPTEGQDVYYAWVEGGRIVAGENPYARILSGDMRLNDKYATYFALFYELAAASRWAGLGDYASWIAFWRVVFLVFTLAIGLLLFSQAYRRDRILLAVFGLAFWLFNRWTLHLTQIAHLDVIPIFLVLASLALFDRHRTAALLLFGASLAIKQIGIFLAPLYLIWAWRAECAAESAAGRGVDASPGPRTAGERTLIATLLLIVAIPLVTSLPFLVWDAEAFSKSILFSATRLPVDHLGVPSFDSLMGWIGLPAKLPMLALMTLTYWMVWRRHVGRYAATFLVLATFVDFNSVLFRQYLAWVVALVPLVALESRDGG